MKISLRNEFECVCVYSINLIESMFSWYYKFTIY